MKTRRALYAIVFSLSLGASGVRASYNAWSDNGGSAPDGMGRDSSIALDGAGNVHLATLNTLTNEIVYDKFTPSNMSSQTPGDMTVIDAVGTLEWHTAIATASAGRVHIAYYVPAGLKYALFDGVSWSTQSVDASGSGAGDAFASIRVDSAGRPHISYYDANLSALKYSSWTGTGWATSIVDGAGTSGVSNSLALDAAGRAIICYSNAADGLKLARWNGSAWTLEIIQASAGQSVGLGCSLALDSSGNPRVSYLNATTGVVRYAQWTGSTWSLQTLGFTGAILGTSIALEPNDRPHIAYGINAPSMAYAKWNGVTWILDVVAQSWAGPSSAPSMILTPAGNPVIAWDQTTGAAAQHYLWLVRWNADATPPVGQPAAPSGAIYSSTAALTFTWSSAGVSDPEADLAGTGYHLQIGTNPATNDASFFDGDITGALSTRVAGAVEGKTYYARVRVRNEQGDYSAFSAYSAGTFVDLTAPGLPSAIVSYTHPDHSTAYPVIRPSLTLSGPADLSGIAGYRWRLDAAPGTIPTAADPLGAATILTTTLLADGTWYFHAKAEDFAGNLSASTTHYKLIVKAAVDPNATTVLLTADGFRIDVPTGAVTAVASVDITTPTSLPATGGGGLAATSVARDLQMTDGTRVFQTGVTLSFPYTVAEIGGIAENSLRLFYYDTSAGAWVLIPNSSVDTLGKRVTAVVNHFTLFAIMGFDPAATSVERLTNYPNPFSPLRGQTTRLRYNLDADREVKIRIYDAFGRAVRSDTFAAGTNGGRAGPNEVVWNGQAGDGRRVEMGGYIAIVESGGKRETVKIGVR